VCFTQRHSTLSAVYVAYINNARKKKVAERLCYPGKDRSEGTLLFGYSSIRFA
jgi:hypothetical protein